MLTRNIPGKMRLAPLTSVARPRITQSEYSLSRAAHLYLVANCIDTVRGSVGIFFLCAGGVSGGGAEFLVSEG